MAWSTSNRRSRLPADWQKIRKRIHRRDRSMCQVRLSTGRPCLEPAIDVDHIIPNDDHRDSNLMCICDWHHSKKSSSEGFAAYRKKVDASKKKFRRDEKHPGMK